MVGLGAAFGVAAVVTASVVVAGPGEVGGLDAARMQRDTTRVDVEIAAATRFAARAHVDSTPSFLVGPTGGALRHVVLTELSADALRPALDELLAE